MESGPPMQPTSCRSSRGERPPAGPLLRTAAAREACRISLPPERRKMLKRIVFGALGACGVILVAAGIAHRRAAASTWTRRRSPRRAAALPIAHAGRGARRTRPSAPRRDPHARRSADRARCDLLRPGDARQGLARRPEDRRRIGDGRVRRPSDQDRARQGARDQHPLRRRPQGREVGAALASPGPLAPLELSDLELDAVLRAVSPPAPAEVRGGNSRDDRGDRTDRHAQHDRGRSRGAGLEALAT